LAYIFVADSFIQIYAVGSKRRIYSATECWPKTDFDVK